MSLYIGKDGNGIPTLHITGGSTDLASMRAGVLDTTVFHSSLAYLTYEIIPITAAVYSSGYTFFTIDRNLSADLGTTNKGYFFIVGGTVYTGGSYLSRTSYWDGRIVGIEGQDSYGAWSDVYPKYGWSFSFTPSYTYNKFGVPGDFSAVTNYLVAVNIVNNAYVPISLNTSGIHMSRTSFTVNGKELLNFKYINPKVINSVDPTGTFNTRQVQLVNLSSAGSTLGLTSSATTGIAEITQGTRAIFSNAFGKLGMHYKGNFSGSFPSYFASSGHTRDFYQYTSVTFSSLGITDLTNFGMAFVQNNYTPVDNSKPVAARTLIAGTCDWTTFSYDADERYTTSGTMLVWYRITLSYRVTSTGIEFRRHVTTYGNVSFTISAAYVSATVFGN